ncbi:MAG: hypothetical protein H0X25_15030 [Acidobacteriales bacterium]|nr:hypothetical protein [Terriglobales bacterium]
MHTTGTNAFLNGEAANCQSIANAVGLQACYVSKVLRFAFLAPDIVEAILDGTQPPHLPWRRWPAAFL